ncbi:SURF1 family protein [uncultured Lentibacter sp.]|uniref:SURF1 family protein n=1 Tax=uncultured Lentibacter sp. TaxID=1659309 RepID=UPI00261D0E87|nr:SURF1 family protein [uncultured Lentibacter sp.]
MKKNWPFLLLSLLVLGALISLGNWQVARMAEKSAYLAAIDARLEAAPVAVPAKPDPVADQFLTVAAQGVLTGPEVRVLVSTRDQGAGYRIIQAFETEGRRLLVDRGYIRVAAKDTPRPAGAATVVGNLHWPDERDSYTPDNDLAANIWYAREVPALAAALQTEPVLIITRRVTPNSPALKPLPLDTSTIPNNHLEYIITWYGLAAVWVLMSAYFLKRRNAKATP